MQTSISKEAEMNFQNNIGTPAIPELIANAPAVIPQNIFLKRQSFAGTWWPVPPRVELSVS